MGPLLDACASTGYIPMPTACDGDCAIDVVCSWMGMPRTKESFGALRMRLAATLGEVISDTRWLGLFDLLLAPDWAPIAKRLAQQARPQPSIPDLDLRSCEARGDAEVSAEFLPAEPEAPADHPASRGDHIPGDVPGPDEWGKSAHSLPPRRREE